jgi:outer membrane protein TolC
VHFTASMTIDSVVSATLRNSPSMAQAGGAVRAGQSGERVAYGAFLPSASLNAGVLQSNQHSLSALTTTGNVPGPAVGYPAQSYSGGLFASYDIFTGGRRPADIASARATTRSANANLVAQRYSTVLLAKETFYGVGRARDLVRVGGANVATATRALQYAESRMQRGTATRADVLLARLNLTTARQQLIAARDTLTTNAYALGRLVGVDGAVAATGTDTLPSAGLALGDSAIVDLAVHSAPSVRAAEENARASGAAVRSAQTQYVPDIKLTGGYNWANNSLTYGAVRPGWVVELSTSYPLFNGFVREDDVTRASANAHTAEVTANDQRRLARAEAERLLASVRFAWQAVGEAEEAVRVSREDLRVVSVRYQNGVATFLDLSTAQVNEAQAAVALVSARYNYVIARASLEALVGREL